MSEDMMQVLVRYYALSEETAREVVMELKDKTSLRSLAGYRVARAVVQINEQQKRRRYEKEANMRRQNWGRWTIDPTGEYPSLDIPAYGIRTKCPYQVRLFPTNCDFPTFVAWLGHWVQHLQEKSWITPADLWNFVEGAQELYRG